MPASGFSVAADFRMPSSVVVVCGFSEVVFGFGDTVVLSKVLGRADEVDVDVPVVLEVVEVKGSTVVLVSVLVDGDEEVD